VDMIYNGRLLSFPPLNVIQQHEIVFLSMLYTKWFVLLAQA
jgi:hypothetical protein